MRIASLNDDIFKAESSGREAHDLRDQRGVLINDLAELVDIEQVQLRDGVGINVGGQLLVGGNHANALSTIPEADNPPFHDVAFVRSDGNAFAISDKIQGGKVGGLLAARDTDVVAFQDRLDRLAANIKRAMGWMIQPETIFFHHSVRKLLWPMRRMGERPLARLSPLPTRR